MTPVNHKLFAQLLQHNVHQLLQEIGSEITAPRSTFGEKHAQMNTVEEEQVYRAAKITPKWCIELQISLTEHMTAVKTGSSADMNLINNELESKRYGITWTEWMEIIIELYICLIKLLQLWEVLLVSEIR